MLISAGVIAANQFLVALIQFRGRQRLATQIVGFSTIGYLAVTSLTLLWGPSALQQAELYLGLQAAICVFLVFRNLQGNLEEAQQ